MCLSLEKCTFGVQRGKFTGFMITQKGIKINPDKCKSIMKMFSMRSIKEVKRLVGHIAMCICRTQFGNSPRKIGNSIPCIPCQ